MTSAKSPLHPLKCQICGLPIGDCISPWMNNFRALYITSQSVDEARISGPGSVLPATYTPLIPLNQGGEAVTSEGLSEVRLHTPHEHSQLGDEGQATDEGNIGGTADEPWGYLVHDSCWHLLTVASSPGPVDTAGLFRSLSNCPSTSLHVKYQGHTYGGIYTLAEPADAPESNASADFDDYRMLPGKDDEEPAWLRLYAADPSAADFFTALLEQFTLTRAEAMHDRRRYTAVPVRQTSAQNTKTSTSPDPFASLPPELRTEILCYIPTSCLISTRCSSRALACTPLSQRFFASRFWAGAEFACVPEALQPVRVGGRYRDYSGLYFAIRKGVRGMGEREAREVMRCRRRVWGLVGGIVRAWGRPT